MRSRAWRAEDPCSRWPGAGCPDPWESAVTPAPHAGSRGHDQGPRSHGGIHSDNRRPNEHTAAEPVDPLLERTSRYDTARFLHPTLVRMSVIEPAPQRFGAWGWNACCRQRNNTELQQEQIQPRPSGLGPSRGPCQVGLLEPQSCFRRLLHHDTARLN